ncbi:MAG: hypothetical protein AAB415_02710 [Patescibacteria group bacterium]
MADDRKKKKDRGGEPAIEFRWDPLVLASDKTFSTTIRIEVSGWWPEGRPKEVSLSVYEAGQEPATGVAVRIQKGHGTFPQTGLKPGHHYHVVAYIEDRTPVQKPLMVPELPKPPRPEVEVLEREQIVFKREELVQKREELRPDPEERALKSDQTRLARAKVTRQLHEEIKEPTGEEKELASLKVKTELVKAKKGFEQAEQELNQARPPEFKRRLDILGTDLRTGVLEVFLCRLGKDGKPESGEVCAVDARRLAWIMNPGEDLVTASFDLRDQPRRVTLFLPDDREVKEVVDIPAKPKEKKPSRPSLWNRMKEAYVQERGGRDGR